MLQKSEKRKAPTSSAKGGLRGAGKSEKYESGLARRSLGEGGQVLLIVILVIVVSLTIVLSLASRSITNVRTSTEEAESQKALSAAEAGVEKALQDLQDVTTSVPLGNNSSYTTDVSNVNVGGKIVFVLNQGGLITQGEGADIWLVHHYVNGEIDYSSVEALSIVTLLWGKGDELDCDSSDESKWPAAIETIVVSLIPPLTSPPNIKTKRNTYDACSGRGNNFDPTFPVPPPLADFGLVTIPITVEHGIFVRVVPIYKSTRILAEVCIPFGVCNPLPPQGHEITSTGTSGEAQRKIKVFKGFSTPYLPYLSYGLFVPAK